MFGRSLRISIIAFICAVPLKPQLGLASETPFHRDWAAHPAVVERAAPETIYALGDVHGDYERMVTLLLAAHISGGTPPHWDAGNAVLVVTGDMIDKGPRPVDVIRLLGNLQIEAKRSGGEVVLLAGNHEAEFLAGPDAKKAADFMEDLKKTGISPKDAAACHGDMGGFLCNLPFAARVGDWFFSHGGNTAGRSIPQISADIARGVDKDGFASKQLTAPDSLLEARLGEGKQQWISSPDEHALLQRYADALGVKHMVQGHQHGEVKFADGINRKAGQMFQRWALLYLIDVGMSRDIDDSQGAILRIRREQVDAIYPDGSHSPLEASK